MLSDGVTVRDRVLAELATLGSADGDALGLLTQVRQVAAFADPVLGELARLAGACRRLAPPSRAGAAGRVSFDAAHVISRAASQISDEAVAAAAEQEML